MLTAAPWLATHIARGADGFRSDGIGMLVFSAWVSLAPHEKSDQYGIWIGRESGLFEIVRYTVREAGPQAMGTIIFSDAGYERPTAVGCSSCPCPRRSANVCRCPGAASA